MRSSKQVRWVSGLLDDVVKVALRKATAKDGIVDRAKKVAEDSAPVRWCMGLFFLASRGPVASGGGTYVVYVPYKMPQERLALEAEFSTGGVSDLFFCEVVWEDHPSRAGDARTVGERLFAVRRLRWWMDPQAIIDEMEARGYLRPTHLEAYAFSRAKPEVQYWDPVVALGSHVCVGLDGEYVAMLGYQDGRRTLRAFDFNARGKMDCFLLFIHQDPVPEKHRRSVLLSFVRRRGRTFLFNFFRTGLYCEYMWTMAGTRRGVMIGVMLALLVAGAGLMFFFRDRADEAKKKVLTPVQIQMPTTTDLALTATSTHPTSTTVVPDLVRESGIHLQRMNQYWLDKINALRREKGLSELAYDARLQGSATAWAEELAQTKELTHVRPEGQTVSEWIRAFLKAHVSVRADLSPERFTENYSRAYANTTEQGVEKALDTALSDFLDEGDTGPHYRTVFSPDWRRVGIGVVLDPQGPSSSRAYIVYHYATAKSDW